MNKYLSYIVCVLLVSLVAIPLMYLINDNNDKFIEKAVYFGSFLILYIVMMICLNNDYIVYLVVFASLINIPIKQLYTSSTNVCIFIALIVLFVRHATDKYGDNMYARAKKNTITLPLVLVICSYTIALIFSKKDFGEHFMIYHSIICAALMVWMIIGTVHEKKQITGINITMLIALLMNLGFSVLFKLSPGIDEVRAKLFSLAAIPDEADSIMQGLSFRGEAYGEYLMLCGLWLFIMLVRGQIARWRAFLWMVTAATVTTLLMNASRGATAIFFLGAILILLTSKTVQLWKKVAAFLGLVLFIASALFVLQTYSGKETILDRFSQFSDTSRNVGYIPQTRYYTWAPSVQLAISQHLMGGGPSFAPNVTETEWQKIVADQASGTLATWPHNIVLLIVCTVGIYGLVCYLFLVFRTLRLRKVFADLEPYLGSCYSGYFICFVMFLLEAQKFDGFLRHPDSNFYLIFILIALLFSCENMTVIFGPKNLPSRNVR